VSNGGDASQEKVRGARRGPNLANWDAVLSAQFGNPSGIAALATAWPKLSPNGPFGNRVPTVALAWLRVRAHPGRTLYLARKIQQ
jgi:hypothetical protein